MSKIIGVTVGTPLSPQTIKEKLKPVLSVNDKKPNANGNVEVAFTLEELTEEQKASLKGDPGADGKDGVSVTHSWNGTTLTIKSASGTSSADLKGDKGEKGEQGAQGVQGVKGDKGDKGDTGEKGSTGSPGKSCTHRWDGAYLYVTSASGTSYANLRGAQGIAGKDGEDGYTPVKGTDYFTEADKAEMVADVIAALPVYDGSVTSV